MTGGDQPHTPTDDQTDALFASFRQADPAFSPVPLWWWSGEPLDPARLRWQLERYREGGVWNLVVIDLAPTGPLYGNPADDPPFMSERWWEIFRGVCADARELGMRIWFYDQIGFSGANIQGQIIGRHPEFAGTTLERVSEIVDGGAALHCPSNGTPLIATVTRLDADERPTGGPEVVPIDGDAVRWVGAGRVRLSLFYTVPRGFDYASPAACAALIDTIHGEFERRAGEFFGDVIVGSFQDELPPMPRWSATFAETFRGMHGYDLLPVLEALWEDLGGTERRVRRDYHATRAALAEEAFFTPLFAWHDARDLLFGVDQQNPARAGDPKGTVSIYADYMRTHRWFGAPGSDHHGEAKIHSSLAHLYGRERVWLEAFHTSGWGGTLEETFDWLVPWLRGGANLYDPHATYYSTRGGWFEWAPPGTDWRQPYWRHYRVFADAVARLCRLLSRGRHVCDIGLLFPTATVQAGVGLDGASSPDAERAHERYHDLVGSMVWFNQRTGALDALGIDYDVLDDDSVARAAIDQGRLAIADEYFRTVILPACTVLERDVARALLAFLDAGGEVIALDILPESLAGADDDEGLIDRLRARLTVHAVDDLGRILGASPAPVTAGVPTLARVVGDATVVFVPAAFPGASHVSGWPVATIDFDRSRYAEATTVRVRDVTGAPDLWDPFTGTRRACPETAWRPVDGGVEVDVAFVDGPCAVLVWGAGAAAEALAPGAVTPLLEIDETWDVELAPTLDNRWGDFTFPPSDGPFPVERWTFGHRGDGDDHWQPVVATFGPRAWWLGPGHPEALIAGAAGAEWQEAGWSMSRGIHKDPLHRNVLGPSGHVPEEFLHFGDVPAGQAVRLRTTLIVDGDAVVTGWLVVGAAAHKRVWLDAHEVSIDDAENARYQTAAPVRLPPGAHTLDLLLTVEQTGVLRASFAVTTDLATFRRPERIAAAGDSVPETTLRFESTIVTERQSTSAVVQVGVNGPARIVVDGTEVGRQGGFLPYGDYTSTHPYDITELLTPGEHTLAVEVNDIGSAVALQVDGVVRAGDGEQWVMTGDGWTVSRDGQPVPVRIECRPKGDPALANWRQRPHPLPGASWLEGPGGDDGSVLPIACAASTSSPVEWLRCLVPPGATRVEIPLIGNATASLDGATLGRVPDASGAPWCLDLPGAEKPRRELQLRVETQPGFAGGAILAGPLRFTCGPGRMALGDWQELGLADYSGMVRYRQTVALPMVSGGERLVLDLGDVRGTAEVTVNGEPMGVRVLAPYRFDITGALSSDRAEIEILVANTLGPYMAAASPTPFVFDGQTISGLFGPVRVERLEA
ncbi:MAG TPA: hypothetical protein VM450_17585 [Thermomicrobiales bacterium]|nr:hypothetical protein [Thermomicrobiales bacterium]